MSTKYSERPTTVATCRDCQRRPRVVYRNRAGAWLVQTYCRLCGTARARRAKGRTEQDTASHWRQSVHWRQAR